MLVLVVPLIQKRKGKKRDMVVHASSLEDVFVPGVFDAVIAPQLHPSDIRTLQTVSKNVGASVPRTPASLAHLLLSIPEAYRRRTTSARSVEMLTKALAHRLPAKQCGELIFLLARVDNGKRTTDVVNAARKGLRGAAMFQLGIVDMPLRADLWRLDHRAMLSYAQIGNKMRQLQGCLLEVVTFTESAGFLLPSLFTALDVLFDDAHVEHVENELDSILYQLIFLPGIGYATAKLFATSLDVCRGKERSHRFSAFDLTSRISAVRWVSTLKRDDPFISRKNPKYNQRELIKMAMADVSHTSDEQHRPHTRAWWENVAARDRHRWSSRRGEQI